MRSRKVAVPRSAGGVGCQLAIAAGEAGDAAHLTVAAGDASSAPCVPKGPGNRVTQPWSALYPFDHVKSEFRRVRGASIESITFKVECALRGHGNSGDSAESVPLPMVPLAGSSSVTLLRGGRVHEVEPVPRQRLSIHCSHPARRGNRPAPEFAGQGAEVHDGRFACTRSSCSDEDRCGKPEAS